MVKRIPLSQGLFALVDDEDYEWLNQWKWTADVSRKSGLKYAIRVSGQGKGLIRQRLSMHRVLMDAHAGTEVDHVNGDTLDNRRANLRLVTRAENLRNRKTFKNSKSGFKGVVFNHVNGKWRVTINFGTFDTQRKLPERTTKLSRNSSGSLQSPILTNNYGYYIIHIILD